MTTISQRELRNNSGEIMRGLRAGQTYTVTSSGEVIGRLVPATASPLEHLVARKARRHGGWSAIPRVTRAESSQSILDDLRQDRL
ncbi:type II toxin-antitoxin system prevent-host-death family antitoxin [Ornithinimicrobium sp. F0845]|uniref:type II toxin-antitoxin system Phd/YefM family antitoxin n=1 Tax=Ornithinimicrobium sp. F0845 TaxID=2926412 RepID=UPI001FF1D75C|nr:type II toxin-antitoxin system prevent-host-death family antitoxin [Ornithinimicrobium sp. F0845]MCK0111784.1 type II toxin-antitoxin system prevent-host-death family antitoxin [Ornithinimicrobium sp. F0845]